MYTFVELYISAARIQQAFYVNVDHLTKLAYERCLLYIFPGTYLMLLQYSNK